ncbi:hypothetical protein ACQKGQ_28845, partial [Bacillus cereus]|uniref:hypothetical protein n=1 Tax=Bacillus cereus TaxID=1396 RepID=UPI003D05EB70
EIDRMSTARLSATEIVNELRSALADKGWLTAWTAAADSAPLPTDASLATIAEALRAHSRTTTIPKSAAVHLERAATAAAAAHDLEAEPGASVALYEHLGSALAYLTQARRVALDPDAPGVKD